MKSFFKSPYNITMLVIFGLGITLIAFQALINILLPIGLDVIAIGMFMWANTIYNANKARKDMDEVTGVKQMIDARQISVDEDIYVVPEEDKGFILKQRVKKHNNTMSFCVLLTVFAFVIILVSVGIYIGL